MLRDWFETGHAVCVPGDWFEIEHAVCVPGDWFRQVVCEPGDWFRQDMLGILFEKQQGWVRAGNVV